MSSDSSYPEDVLRRLHEAEMAILIVLDDLCKEHGLTYFLESGTALGAVRHGGFIPWDDDIDISMPLDDYRRFLEIAPTALPDGFSLHTAENTKGMGSLWAKVFLDGTRFMDEPAVEAGCEQAIFVDVFCYRRLDADERVAKRQIAQANFWQRVSYLACFAHPVLPKDVPLRPVVEAGCVAAHAVLSRCVSKETIRRGFERAWALGNNPSDNWSDTTYAYLTGFTTDMLFPTAPLTFEGRVFPGPHDVDAYLRVLYGDYMWIPPVEERHNHLPLILDFGDGVNVMER